MDDDSFGFDKQSFKTACLFTNRHISGLSTSLYDAVKELSQLRENIQDRNIKDARVFDAGFNGTSMKWLLMFITAGSVILACSYGVNNALRKGFTMSDFVGWPKEKHLHTVMVGILLGFVFGFLDNFGLFYGMDKLDPLFYKFASVTMLSHASNPESLHKLADGMMNGLGNTFSDLLGILIGTAVLLSANASFNVSAGEFWPIDFVAITLGCFVGAYLPALLKEGETSDQTFAKIAIGIMCLLLLICMVAPSDGIEWLHYLKWGSFLLFIILISVNIFRRRMFGRNSKLTKQLEDNVRTMLNTNRDGEQMKGIIDDMVRLQNKLAKITEGQSVAFE